MSRFIACFAVIVSATFSAFSATPASEKWVANLLQKKLSAKSVTVHISGDGFVAKASFPHDSVIILVGGIGKSIDQEISMNDADLNTSVATSAFIQGKFGTDEPLKPITLTTAFAQKGEWMVEGDEYITIKVLDADKVLYQ